MNYSGTFKFGKLCGEGKCAYPGGDIYSGSFENNLQNGAGKYGFSNEDTFEGEFLSGHAVETDGSKNVYTSAEGNVYTGETRNMKPHGKGVLKVIYFDDIMLILFALLFALFQNGILIILEL